MSRNGTGYCPYDTLVYVYLLTRIKHEKTYFVSEIQTFCKSMGCHVVAYFVITIFSHLNFKLLNQKSPNQGLNPWPMQQSPMFLPLCYEISVVSFFFKILQDFFLTAPSILELSFQWLWCHLLSQPLTEHSKDNETIKAWTHDMSDKCLNLSATISVHKRGRKNFVRSSM